MGAHHFGEVPMKPALTGLCLLLPVLAGAQSLDLKLGAWEMTHKSSELPRAMVDKECLTKADLAELARGPDKDDDDGCKPVRPPTLGAKTWSADKVCEGDRKVHAEFTVESPERVRGFIAVSATKGSKAVTLEVAGRWIGASCSGIK
jgi:Protein of unknown function (DUF3617)